MVRNAEIHSPCKSKFKMNKFRCCDENMFILYTIHIVCYIKKTKAKPLTQFYINDDGRFIRHIIYILHIYGWYSGMWYYICLVIFYI